MRYQRVDRFLLAHANRRNIFHCILNEGPINKSTIAQRVGLSLPSVMKIVDSLAEDGLIRSIGKGASSGGKPPELLEIVPDAHFAVGVDIGLSQIRILLCDMGRNIRARREMPTPRRPGAEALAALLEEGISECIGASGIQRERILGVGLGAPGLIDLETGIIRFSPHFHWEQVDLRGMLARRLPYPVGIDNVTQNIARAEYELGAGKGAKYVFNLNLGRGIASAFVLQGNLYDGANGLCGEIGHLTVAPDGPVCACGNRGCLEAMASGEAIARHAQVLAKANAGRKLLEMAHGRMDRMDAKMVFEADAAGDPCAKAIVDQAMEYIGIALAGVINLMDVERVVVSGGLTKNGARFWTALEQSVSRHLMKNAGTQVQLLPAALGDAAAALGAACHIFQRFWLTL